MNKREQQEFSELEELLWRAEEAIQEPEEDPVPEDMDPDEFDFEDYSEEPEYRNYANGYGEAPARPRQTDYQPKYHNPAYDQEAYPGTYGPEDNDPEDYYPEEDYVPPQPKPRPRKAPAARNRKKRRGCGCGCLTWLAGLLLAGIVALCLFVQPPQSEESIGDRKSDTATILVCGTDADGTRTDTMMLLYLSGSERRVGLLSLPRDSYTITSSGSAAKLNSTYGRNGRGEEGMNALMDYVKDIIGYRPDGYILVDFTLVPQIVDIMGGVDVEVPMDMEVDGVFLKAGYQHLSGQEVLTILRFRKGYATADLGRVEVQRTVLKACMSQWASIGHIGDAMEAVSLLESGSTSTLTTGNYLWMAKTLLLGMGDFTSDTLPGTAEYRSDVSYYILSRSGIAALINESYNPYEVTITESDLNIAN